MADIAEISFFDKSDYKKKRNGNANFNVFFNLSKTSVELKNTSRILS